MRRREFIAGLGSTAAWPLAVRAQQPAIPVIGFIAGNSPESAAEVTAAFRKGLSEKGYVEGGNVRIEYRFANSDFSRYPELASDLVARRVAVIAIAAAGPAARAAKAATKSIPIVFGTAGDPVQEGLVASLNRPGGNATGFTNMALELSAKRLEVLHQMLPQVARIALLVTPYSNAEVVRVTRDAASAIGVHINVVSVSTQQDIEGAFTNFADARAEALMVPTSPLFGENRAQIVALAARHKMPTVYYDRPFVVAGGLMSYGASVPEQARQVGIYTGRILAGEKPADLPVQQATKVELSINLKTAKALGLVIPETLLATADEVIQ
jgi:putative tryptophan/tyrosine transport system substrate-binding protein